MHFSIHAAPLPDPDVIIQQCYNNNMTETKATIVFILHECIPGENIQINIILGQCSSFSDDNEIQKFSEGRKLKYEVKVSNLQPNTTYCYAGVAFNTSSQENISDPCFGNFTTRASLRTKDTGRSFISPDHSSLGIDSLRVYTFDRSITI